MADEQYSIEVMRENKSSSGAVPGQMKKFQEPFVSC